MDEPIEQDQSTPEVENNKDPVKESDGLETDSHVASDKQPVSGTESESSPTDPVSVAPQAVVADHSGGSKRRMKLFIILLLVAALAAGGWYAYKKHQDNQKAAKAAVHSKDIPLLKIGTFQAGYGGLYPQNGDNEYSAMVDSQMFEGLVRYEGKSKIVPDIASGWTNPDSSTWLFTVKSGIKFHDGHTLTTKDVKYSLDLIKGDPSLSVSNNFASTIDSVSLVGSNQVKITTNTPDPALLNKLNFLYIIDSNQPKGTEPSQGGTGPYEITPGTKPSDTHVQMVAFDGYHGGRPTTRALDFGSNEDAAKLFKDFQDHKYNIIGPMPLSKSKSAGATQFIVNEADVSFLGFNTIKPGPLQNKQVREAIRYAVNPSAIAKASDTQTTPESQLIPPTIPGYNPAIAPYKQNIAKAKQLLAQAGYPNGLTLRLSVSATSSENQNRTAELVSELKQVGITATVDEHDDFSQFIDYFTSGQAEMYEVDYSSDTLDGLDIYTTTLVPANYDNPQLNDILGQVGTTTDPAKRLKLLQSAAVIINQDIPVVPLYSEQNLWLVDKNYNLQQDMPSSLISVYFYKVQFP